jgi:hypothetical protein
VLDNPVRDRLRDERIRMPPDAADALTEIYADPPSVAPLWFREKGGVVREHERAEGWGTYNG